MKNIGARVYSYLRFSDPRQATGSSADRQLQYAQRWAAERGLMLDESLSLRDEGLSAYHQQHVKQGALGAFLRAVDDGRIPDGSVLIVEGLDRLSRAEPIQAQAQLAQIINAGITVVTASDGREYNRAGLKAQPMDLVYSLLVMIRAHEESDTKSKRVKASIRRLCEGWVAGTYRGLVRNGKDPAWVSWTGREWELVPDRVAAVRRALELYQQGYGAGRAAKLMYQEGYELTDWGIAGQQIYRLIKLPALRGAKRISVDGEDYLLEGYYPALLTETEYDELQYLASQRHRRRGAGVIPGIITGVGLTYCGYCGTALVAQNIMGRAKADGSLADGHRRLQCTAYSKQGGCTAGGSCSVVPVERALLNYCGDQINLQRLYESPDDGRAARERLAVLRREAAELERQLGKITDALLADESGAAPLAFVRRARELEQQLGEAQQRAQQAERELTSRASQAEPARAARWQALAEQVEAGDYAAREQVRQLVMDTFERIVVYMRGIGAEGRQSKNIDVMLVPKAGRPLLLRINRRSGDWRASEGS
ncbi:recombinase family protein [Atopomonas sediminilitoris]|uniref:recombinase family protein n=1 Tax=Atopomonas sediminilitoris TaxID=2919919 RepID=UPI001F4EAD1E|nr:recombinase family protein [Atopomonas sediminilitoris]MCJ8168663.1 recombinase family protein [Atopomonas sediminilitoris]